MPILFSLDINIDDITYVALVKKFEDPKKNLAIERHSFFREMSKIRGNPRRVLHRSEKSQLVL